MDAYGKCKCWLTPALVRGLTGRSDPDTVFLGHVDLTDESGDGNGEGRLHLLVLWATQSRLCQFSVLGRHVITCTVVLEI